MFYKEIEAAYIAGNVKIGLPAVGDRVSVQAQGINRLKAFFLNTSEKNALKKLSIENATAQRLSK